ncbi:sensor histidine kinase [Streptomyces cavernicola]|uniref:histidine kinase n=1 Tax=Streptomyces cavernicola TaxID=3043613 RepID=A0ABT6SMW5_9ACTN|nr:histidine kinase [Streptomyces sp. B-S-A6]MDI3409027.1 histidine kinase [Streptomyces sp. B-S-A6]
MYSTFPFSPGMRRLFSVAALVVLALTWFADFGVLFLRPGAPASGMAVTSWIPAFITGPLAALTLPDNRWLPALTRRAVLVAAVSVALSCVCLFIPQDGAGWGFLETVALLLLIIRVLAQVQPAQAAAWVIAPLVAAVLMLPLRDRSQDTLVVGAYVLTLLLAVCVTLGSALRAQEARRQRAVHDVRQAERLALARDLHDLVAHHMTGIIVQANAARTVHATAPDKVEPILESITRAGTETLASMRRLVRVLREYDHDALLPGDLLAELGELTAEFARHNPDSPPVRLEVTAAARSTRFSPEAEASVHRVVREALTNVHRHAPGQHATVRLDATPDWLLVTVTNTLPSHPAGPAGGRGGLGLIGLQERIEALDGTFRAGPSGRGQWRVTARLPRHPVPPVG